LTLLLTSQQNAQAFNLNGKKWVEKRLTIILPASLDDPKLIKRIKFIAMQIRKNVPFKVSVRIRESGAFISLYDELTFATEEKAVVVLYTPGETFGLGTRVANAGFIASNGGNNVHASLVRINDLRYQTVTDGGDITYLANLIGHEVGHAVGLDHASSTKKPRPIMSIGKFGKVGLTRDDKKGLRKVYR